MKSRSGRVVATVTRLKGFTGGILLHLDDLGTDCCAEKSALDDVFWCLFEMLVFEIVVFEDVFCLIFFGWGSKKTHP